MEQNLWIELVHNAALLLTLFISYEVSYFIAYKSETFRRIFNGLFIAAICIAIMGWPFHLYPGITFDTRTILLSVSALTLGAIPAGIAAAIAAVFRITLGGAGTIAGIATILSSTIIGLLWRGFLYPKTKKLRWLSIYAMSLTAHIAMLMCMLLLPRPYITNVIRTIAPPVILIYPVASVLLAVLLIHQYERRQYQEEIRTNEEKYRRITENISDVVWTSDLELNITYVSQSVETLMGEPREIHIKRSLQEKLTPESMRKMRALFREEMAKENDPGSDKNRTRLIEVEHYKPDGSTLWLSVHVSFLRDFLGNAVGIQGISRDISERKAAEKALERERSKAQQYLDIARVVFLALDRNMSVTLINREGCQLLGLPKEEILGKNWIDNFVPFPHRLALEKGLHSIIEGGSVYDIHENPVMTRDKGDRMISWHNAFLKDESGEITGILSSGIDITDQSAALEALRESERSKSVLISHIPGMAYRCSSGADRTMYFISEGCNALTGYNVQDLINNGKVSYDDLICGEYREDVRNEWERAISAGKPFRYEYEIADASGERKWVMEMGQAVFGHEGDIEALEGIIIDITESKTALEKIRYMDKHDYMTGLYNRKYYELEKERIENEGQVPVSVVMVDINGLRLINDAFGHAAGDRLIIETAKIMQSCCGEGDVLARTGGGEFTAILPGTDMPKAFNMLDAIISKLNSYNSKISANEQAINLSIGFGIKDGENGTLAGAEKESGEYLRRGKLFEQKSHHNAVLSSLMATMYARSQETEEHSQRISRNCIRIAEKLGVPKNKQDEIHLFAMLHDIGKVGISDSILNKPGKLAAKEWAIMKTHPEIGYRIARSAPEFEGVADYILAHHERWDGKGYPYGLAGEKIPLLSRILAVADAYDAMTSESRAYRAPLTGKMALAEIRSNAGTQFDPNVVRAFIEIMDSSAD